MTTVAGNGPLVIRLMSPATSTNLLTPLALDRLTRALVGTAPVVTAANGMNEPIDITGALHGVAGAGGYLRGWGDYWFERIHVLPAVKSYPFIFSSQHIFVEVYNAFRLLPQTVTSIIETGPTGVSILTPHVVPIVFAPLQSKIFDVLVSSAGPPRAGNSIDFDFAGVPEPVLTITGLRLLPFTIAPDWDAGIEDEVSYLTDVMVSLDDTEQRIQLRQVPNRSLTYRFAALDTRENGLLASLIWNWQSRSYGVLLWMDAAPLTVDAAAGTLTVMVDTTHMTITVGDTVILLTDAFTWFASQVDVLTPTSVTLETPLDRDFLVSARTLVVPIILGRVAPSLPLARPTNATTIASIKFDLQVVAG